MKRNNEEQPLWLQWYQANIEKGNHRVTRSM